MKMRVLFVDDQPEILAGLRRMLRVLRNEWDMEFAESGEQALALAAKLPFDVVVSDMRMPGMDGTQLLTKIKAAYPETVRIILSGQADQTSVLRAVVPAHQYLAKPCDAEALKNTVARACSLRDTLQDKSLIRVVSNVTTLPSLPHIFTKLLEELQKEDASMQVVSELIARDVGMTAKLLQMVNSAFFGIPRRVESPAHAAALLGLDVLKPLVLSAGVFSQFDTENFQTYSVDDVMEHSLFVSRLAEEIAKSYSDDKHLAEDALIAGLLHDVGQLLLLAYLPEQFADALTLGREKGVSLFDAEIEYLGASHGDVGAYLLGLWGLADPIVEAVAFHHRPARSKTDAFCPLTAVHVANMLANDSQPSCDVTYSVDVDVDYLERIGVADQLPKWRDAAESFHTARASLT